MSCYRFIYLQENWEFTRRAHRMTHFCELCSQHLSRALGVKLTGTSIVRKDMYTRVHTCMCDDACLRACAWRV